MVIKNIAQASAIRNCNITPLLFPGLPQPILSIVVR
jgi:hypothetical protein